MGDNGDLLRAARERLRLSQQDVADLVGVSRASVGSWEKGVPPRSSLGRLLEVLELDAHLRPLGSSDSSDFRSMDNREFVARLNVLVSQLNAAVAEAARRLQDFEAGISGQDRTAQADHAGLPTDGRYVMNIEDIELDQEDVATGTKGESAAENE